MALNANALITLAELKIWLNISGNTEDSRLEAYINTISSAIEKYLKRTLKAGDYTEKYSGTDEQELILNNYPVNSVDSVAIDGIELNEEDYEFLSSGVLLKSDGWLISGLGNYLSGKIDFPERNIEVTYNAGFETVPDDLKLVVYEAVSDLYFRKKSGGEVIQSKKVDDVSVTFVKKEGLFSPDILTVLNGYKRRRI